MKLDTTKPSPETHPVGLDVELKTIDNMEIKGRIEACTSDAMVIKTDRTTVRVHPHEIYYCIKV